MKNRILITLFICLFAALSANLAFAAGPGTSSLALNEELLAKGIELSKQGVAFAQEGNVAETKKATYEALDAMSSINSSTWDRKLQRPRGKIRKAYIIAKRMLDGKAKSGDSMAAAAELIQIGVDGLLKVQQISQHNL